MLRVVIRRVHREHLELLREWLREANGPRRVEALATLHDEGCAHEQALLIEGADGPVLIYVMQVDDESRSIRAAVVSAHPIDAEHQRVLRLAVGDEVPSEVLLDLRA